MKKFGLIAIIIACILTGCSGEKKQATEAGSIGVTATVSDVAESTEEVTTETEEEETTTTVSQNDEPQTTAPAQQAKPQSEKPAAKPQATPAPAPKPQSEKPAAPAPAPKPQSTEATQPATTEHQHAYSIWVVDKAAWTETIEHPEDGRWVFGAECHYCGQFFNTGGEAANHNAAQADDEHFVAGWGTAERYVVDKAAWTETIQHPEEGHWECSCGAKK